jgi:hypothetical protein
MKWFLLVALALLGAGAAIWAHLADMRRVWGTEAVNAAYVAGQDAANARWMRASNPAPTNGFGSASAFLRTQYDIRAAHGPTPWWERTWPDPDRLDTDDDRTDDTERPDDATT